MSGNRTPSSTGTAPRIAIIGGGIGGVTCAYLLGPDRPVDLFEALPKLGGHADTEIVKDPDGDYYVDVGAQFFHPETHPLYVCLLRQVGLFDDSNTETGMSRKMTDSLSIFEMDSAQIRLCSTHPFDDIIAGLQFAAFTEYARKIQGEPWDKTVQTAVNTPPLSLLNIPTDYFLKAILMPWLSSAVGAPLETINQASIRSSLQGFARSFPENPLDTPITYNSSIGLGGNVQYIAGKSSTLTPRLNTPVKALTLEGARWYVNTDRDRHGPYDAVIVNAPPHDSVSFFEGRPSIERSTDLVGILKRYKYFDTNISVHRDPAYMPNERDYWSLYNVGVTGSNAEGSVWHRPEHPSTAGQPAGIFKSWVTRG